MIWIYVLIFVWIFSVLYLIYILRRDNAFNRHEDSPLGIHPRATMTLQQCNLLLHQLALPPLICVYLLGIVETISTLIWKRGLLGAPSHLTTEYAIDQLVKDAQGISSSTKRTTIITGGDSGIGFEIARGLLMAGFRVIIASRTSSLGKQAQHRLKELTGSDDVMFYTLDLCSFDDVHTFVIQMKSFLREEKIDVLINNAGVMNIPYTVTKDGLEAQCQTNYLSPLLLTVSLLPLMNKDHGHILFASSSTLYAVNKLDPLMAKTCYTLDGLHHYAHSKMCVTLLAKKLGERLTEHSSCIKVNSYHPGTVRTNLFAHTSVFNLGGIVRRFFDFIMLTPKEGSGTALYLVTTFMNNSNNLLLRENGYYWADGLPQRIPKNISIQSSTIEGSSLSTIDKLWTASLAQINISPLDVENWIKSTVK
ncbi:uncharacterized protein BX664DRAFT_387685 [Halteromyces radiatus]|uniref:uncharacterized protein n=1 Tax=Halteromyces radiatus TaxID=101107 RepID=UPI0022211799|nr:uncharacterized protein BX664DRAFT_387685 [Halteromyces radiatus]KAI8085043.1 hypothetical protein BX664DRAFT_387685 [Halteromyces radiatus]